MLGAARHRLAARRPRWAGDLVRALLPGLVRDLLRRAGRWACCGWPGLAAPATGTHARAARLRDQTAAAAAAALAEARPEQVLRPPSVCVADARGLHRHGKGVRHPACH